MEDTKPTTTITNNDPQMLKHNINAAEQHTRKKLEHMHARMAQLKARIQDLRDRQEKANTRCYLLAGRCLFETAKRDPEFARRASSELTRFLSRDADRKLMQERLNELSKLTAPKATTTDSSPPRSPGSPSRAHSILQKGRGVPQPARSLLSHLVTPVITLRDYIYHK